MIDTHELVGLQPAGGCERGKFTTVLELPGRPGLLCKQVDRLLVDERFDPISTGGRYVTEYSRDLFFAVLGSELALLSDSRYNLARFIPKTDLVWGVNEQGVERGFIVTERVGGVGLSEPLPMDARLANEVDEMLAGLIVMGIDHSGPPGLGRLGKIPDVMRFGTFTNIIVGTTVDDAVVHPRFVDLHPVLAPEVSGNAGKWWDIGMADLVADASGYPFGQAHAALEALFGPAPRM